MFIPKEKTGAVKAVSMVAAGICLALSILVWIGYDKGGLQFPLGAQYLVSCKWIPAIGASFIMGADGLSVPLIFLTALLTLLAMIYSAHVEMRTKEYYLMFLLLETGMFGVFTALDFVLFFVFWELSLVPMYFLIGIWGGPRKEYASIKFFIYTMVGSMAMLLCILALYFAGGNTFNMMTLALANPFGGAAARGLGTVVFWGMLFGFAVKLPMWPFHTWLPDAHVEAPTAGSVILAGVLLKMGSYGFMRVLMPMLPEQFARFWVVIAVLAVVAIVYGAFVAMAQTDLKKLIAYSSVNHMGFVTLGCAVAAAGVPLAEETRALALNGAQMQSFSHGLITGTLFLLVGVIYDRTHTREMANFGGLGVKMPVYAGMLSFCAFASLGLPGMTGFIAEISVLLSAFAANATVAAFSLIGLVVTAAYMLWMLQRVILGAVNPKLPELKDVCAREVLAVSPLMALTLFYGVLPSYVLSVFNGASVVIAGLFK